MFRDMRARAPRVAALVVIAAVAGSFVLPEAGAADERFRVTARVRLKVSADGATSSIVQSYLSRELRKLDGVMITDDDPGYELSVIVMQIRNQANYVTGYALSSVGLSLWQKSSLEGLVQTMSLADTEKALLRMFAENGTLVHHFLLSGPTSDLETMCSRLAASFDTDAVEPSRRMMQQIRDRAKTLSPGKR